MAFAGIALFTYHKYRKSIDSPVPLDGHGNPITDSDDALEDRDAEERAPLTAHVERDGIDAYEVSGPLMLQCEKQGIENSRGPGGQAAKRTRRSGGDDDNNHDWWVPLMGATETRAATSAR